MRYRDQGGRFRRKTVADMTLLERITHYLVTREVLKPLMRNSYFENLQATAQAVDERRIGTSLRIRLPTDFKIKDRNILP